MKKQALFNVLSLLFALYISLPVTAQGVIVYKKDSTYVKYSYDVLDRIETYICDEEPEVPDSPGDVYGKLFDIFSSLSYDEMVYVEGGTFKMGAQSTSSSLPNYDSKARSNECPVHSVALSSYYIGKYEVTQQLWEYVMNYTGTAADGSTMSAVAAGPWLGDRKPSSENGLGDYCPAYFVSYNDIVNHFIPRLNKITGKTFRLPTEAEWEYAARGGNQSKGYRYSGSNDPFEVGWSYAELQGFGPFQQVGTKQGNELGIYDMSGNVWEWCSDWYGPYNSTSETNPTGAISGTERVCRGGGISGIDALRVTWRISDDPSEDFYRRGFRLACEPH